MCSSGWTRSFPSSGRGRKDEPPGPAHYGRVFFLPTVPGQRGAVPCRPGVSPLPAFGLEGGPQRLESPSVHPQVPVARSGRRTQENAAAFRVELELDVVHKSQGGPGFCVKVAPFLDHEGCARSLKEDFFQTSEGFFRGAPEAQGGNPTAPRRIPARDAVGRIRAPGDSRSPGRRETAPLGRPSPEHREKACQDQ